MGSAFLNKNLAPIAGSEKNEEYKLEAIEEIKKKNIFVCDKSPRG